jgi:chromosome segregation ATPase
MALTRKMLKAMGIEEEKIDQIIEAHSETVDSLKADRDNYKKDADQLKSVREELDELKAKGDDGWKEKHDKLKGDFDTYKKDVEAKETHSKKVEAFKAILKDGNFSEKGIEKAVKYADFEKMELDEDGKTIKNAPEHLKAAKEEWAEYVTTTTTTGAKTSNPPANNGTGTGKTKEEIMAIKDGAVRRAEMAKNPHLFGLDQNN